MAKKYEIDGPVDFITTTSLYGVVQIVVKPPESVFDRQTWHRYRVLPKRIWDITIRMWRVCH